MSGDTSRSDIVEEMHASQYRAAADAAYRAAVNAPAPGHLPGESTAAYRLRLASGLKGFSPTYKSFTVESLASMHQAGALHIAEETIFHDAVAAARRPVGPLRETHEFDQADRKVIRFAGDPEHCWGQFKLPVRRVARFNCPGGDL